MDKIKPIAKEIYQGIISNVLDDIEKDNPYMPMLPKEAREHAKNEIVEFYTPEFLKNNPSTQTNLTSYLTLTINPNDSNTTSTPTTYSSSTSDSAYPNLSSTPNTTSYLNSTPSPISFKITKATIKESLEEPFSIECEGYIESLREDLFSISKEQELNFHPKVLIDSFATFSIDNPYENKTLDSNFNATKNYKGIIAYVNYLGINKESLTHLVDMHSTIKTLKYKHFFSFKVTSALIRLSLNKASRIYTHTTILEAIRKTLDFYQGLLNKEIDFSNIHLSYHNKELISQYQESDLDFITRLAHNNGIFFYEDASKIYFCDHYAKSEHKKIKYNPNINNVFNEPCITQIYKEQNLRANSFTLSSINAREPLNLLALHSNKAELNPKATYKEHIYEGAYSFTQDTDLKTLPNLKEKRVLTLNESLSAKSNIYHLSLKDFIEIDCHTLTNHNIQETKEMFKNFVVIANTQTLIDDAILSNSFNTNDNLELKDLNLSKTYSNTLTLLPSHFVFTPSFKPKPKAPNSTQGIVIGKTNTIESERNTIVTDTYGRVKVRIHLYANQEELDEKDKLYHHTPFLRVSTPIASSHSGFYHTPRVGDEVIISFLDDDIDKPYVSGGLYNSTTAMPQYNYPRYKREIASNALTHLSTLPNTMYKDFKGLDALKFQENTNYVLNPINNHYLTLANSTIGTDNTQANARNEITLKNDKDKEEIYILAQKDYKIEIGNAYEETIKHNKISEVGALYTEFITLGHMQNIMGFKNVNVGAEYLENTLLSKDTNVGLNNALNVGEDNRVRINRDSNEYVGGNKETEVRGNFITQVKQDEKHKINGHFNIQSKEELNLLSQSQINLNANENILLTSKQSLSMHLQDYLVTQAKNAIIEVLESFKLDSKIFNLESKESINIKVGNAEIEIKNDTITINKNGNTMLLNNDGINIRSKKITIHKGS